MMRVLNWIKDHKTQIILCGVAIVIGKIAYNIFSDNGYNPGEDEPYYREFPTL